jgi:hypothetical protein
LFGRGSAFIQAGTARGSRNISKFGADTVTDSGDTLSRQLDEWSTAAGSIGESDTKVLNVSGDDVLRGEPPLAEEFLMFDGLIKDRYVARRTSALCSANDRGRCRSFEDERNEEENDCGNLEGSHGCEVVTTVEWLNAGDGGEISTSR